MAQADKIIEKIKAKPAPKNIKWDELVTALKRLGYKEITNSGSRRKFFHTEKNNMCWRRLNFDHLCRLNLDQGLLLV